MCRFVAYLGEPVRISDLILRPDHSLVRQSLHAKRRHEPVNGDGFGLGWYEIDGDAEPGIYTSVEPAWSNRNLARLSQKLKSRCFFAHVRDATPGMPVTPLNCHPFGQGAYLWMHNGAIAGFNLHRRALLAGLSDMAFNMIQGNTDSEYLFALFMDTIDFQPLLSPDGLAEGLKETFARLETELAALDERRPSRLNCAVTNGASVSVTRHTIGTQKASETLFYSVCSMINDIADPNGNHSGIIIASEPLDEFFEDWTEIPPGSVIWTSPEDKLKVEALTS